MPILAELLPVGRFFGGIIGATYATVLEILIGICLVLVAAVIAALVRTIRILIKHL